MTIEELYNEAKKRNATNMDIYGVDRRIPEGYVAEKMLIEVCDVDISFTEYGVEISLIKTLDDEVY